MLKAEAWPLSRDAPNWRADAIDFRRQARDAYVSSMRQKIDVAELYADALAAMPETIDGVPPLPVPAECPVTLDELLAADYVAGAALVAMARSRRSLSDMPGRSDARTMRTAAVCVGLFRSAAQAIVVPNMAAD